MLFATLYTITFFAGLICLLSIFLRKKKGEHILINKFLITVFILSDIRFLAFAMDGVNTSFRQTHLSSYISVLCMILLPSFIFLYFNDIIFEKTWTKRKSLHLLFPALFCVLLAYSSFANQAHFTNRIIIICIFNFFFYVVAVFRLLSKHIWNRKSDIKAVQAQNQLLRNWSIFMFCCMLFITVASILLWAIPSTHSNNFFYIDNIRWISSILWTFIYSIVLVKPEILYGYNYLYKTANLANEKIFKLEKIWHVEQPKKAIVSQKEQMLTEKINTLIPSYIHKLENLSLQSDFFRNPDCTINDVASEVKIPVSHLSYLFRYHCSESFVDYKKIIRTHDAVNLIKQGYLKTNTIESLATLVGFVTYSTFSIAFKEITGNTAQEYVEEKNLAPAR